MSAPAVVDSFEVELARSGEVLCIGPGESILDALLLAGIDIEYSCMQGVCGTCRTRVLSGIPHHRDLFLSPQEQAANDSMLVCCSGSRSSRLVLDR
jgi:ferredoxin